MTHNKSAKTIAYTFRNILLHELKSIKKWRKIAIRGQDPEGVHQIRISLRRIRTALIVFKPVINTKNSQKLAKKTKKFASILDNARDLDVYILMNSTKKADSFIKDAAISERHKAYKCVKKLVKSKSFRNCLRRCKKWVKNGKWQNKALPEKKQNKALKSFASSTLNKLMNVIIIQGQQPERLNDLALHKLRIDCKRLRYTTEFFIALYDEITIITFLEKLKALQDSLGDIHDVFIQNQLYYKLLKNNKKIQFTPVSEQIQRQIDYTAELKKLQLFDQLNEFYQTKFPW